jgi:hypothetical protein
MHAPAQLGFLRSPLFALAFVAVLFGGMRSFATLRADETSAEEKQRKQIKGALRKGQGTWYAIQLMRSTYSQGAVRSTMVTRIVRRRPVMVKQDVVTDQRVLVPTAEYVVVERLEPAEDAIIKHIGPPKTKATKSHRATDKEEPPEETSWNFLGRYKTRAEADEQVDLARQAFEAENHWRFPEAKKGRRDRLQP